MNHNPHLAPYLIGDVSKTFDSIKRIDRNGYFYEVDYQENYYHPMYVGMIRKIEELANFKAGCSAFYCQNNHQENITVRNYDFGHHINNDSTKPFTGLTILVKCSSKGKHKSIGLADGFWLDLKGNMYQGMLDDNKTDISSLVLVPYLCMDGINDEGLTASILMVNCNKANKDDTKTDQNEPNKIDKVSHARLLRYILDNCSNVSEAIKLASSYNIFSLRYSNFQILVTDRFGQSEVLAWRFNKFTHTQSNVVTNFNLSGQLDDACDIYEDNKLVDRFTKINNTLNEYHYGYGKGFNRFETIVSSLERHAIEKIKDFKTDLNEEIAMSIIKSVAVFPSKALSSMTQYSVLYNNNKNSLKVFVYGDFKTEYNFHL